MTKAQDQHGASQPVARPLILLLFGAANRRKVSTRMVDIEEPSKLHSPGASSVEVKWGKAAFGQLQPVAPAATYDVYETSIC